MQIRLYSGDREAIRSLFELADDSERAIASYMHAGEVLVAEQSGAPVGQILLTKTSDADTAEIKSLAVRTDRQTSGIGRALIDAAVEPCKVKGLRRLVLATAAADVGNLRFYQRTGFRMLRIERDAFTAAHGYTDDGISDGIPLRDWVWFDREV